MSMGNEIQENKKSQENVTSNLNQNLKVCAFFQMSLET